MRTSDTVTPIDTAADKVGKAINVGTSPDAIAITPNGKTVYVGSLFAETVTPIRTVTNTPGKAISAGSPVPSRSRRTGRPPTSSTTPRTR